MNHYQVLSFVGIQSNILSFIPTSFEVMALFAIKYAFSTFYYCTQVSYRYLNLQQCESILFPGIKTVPAGV